MDVRPHIFLPQGTNKQNLLLAQIPVKIDMTSYIMRHALFCNPFTSLAEILV